MVTDGQLISLMSHTIGSIGQVLKDLEHSKNAIVEIERIYKGYIKQISATWRVE